MKIKLKRYGKRTVSVLLSLMMIVSLMTVGQIATIDASADTTYYIAGDGITNSNGDTNNWDAGDSNFALTYVSSNRYTIVLTLAANVTFKMNTGSASWIQPSTTQNSGSVIYDNGNLKNNNGAGTYLLCFDPTGGSSGSGWVWLEEVPDTSVTQEWQIVGKVGGTDITGATMTSNGDGTYTYATGKTYAEISDSAMSGSHESDFYFKRIQTSSKETYYGSGLSDANDTYWLCQSNANTSYQLSSGNTTGFFFSSSGASASTKVVDLVVDETNYTFKFVLRDPKTAALGTTTVNAFDVNGTSQGTATESGSTAVTVEGNSATSSLSGSTFTVNTICASSYIVNSVRYSYTKENSGGTGSGTASAVTANTQYAFTVPSDIEDDTAVNITVNFKIPGTLTVSAYIDNSLMESNGNYPGYIKIDYTNASGSSASATSINTGAAPQYLNVTIQEGTSVKLTVYDHTRNNDLIIDKWAISGTYNGNPTLEAASRGDSTQSLEKLEIELTPTNNITASAFFKEDEGVAYENYHVMYNPTAGADSPDGMTGAAQVYKTYSGLYYASVESSGFTNNAWYYCCLSSSNSNNNIYLVDNDPHVEVDSNVSKYVKGQAKNGGFSWTPAGGTNGNYHYAQFGFKNATVTKIKILLNDPTNSTYSSMNAKYYKISADLTANLEIPSASSGNALVIAKDGTLRTSYQKYSKIADTTIDSAVISGTTYTKTETNTIDDHAVSIASFNGLSETVTLPQGSAVTFTTEIPNDTDEDGNKYCEKYYVKAWNINGETYFPDTTTPVTENGETISIKYTCTYTIPSGTNCVEITPIYYYALTNNKTIDNIDVVTFYVEGFDDTVKSAWGRGTTGNAILSCYAWYNIDQGYDVGTAGAATKPALGGYPGQPMVYENGRYQMQIPKYVDKATNNGIIGITLNNYVWDDAHSFKLNGSEADDNFKKANNCQTYDYDDFIELAKLTDDVIFRFKYRTGYDENNGTTDTRNGGNAPGATLTQTTYDSGNGYEVYTDYYGNVIDLRNYRHQTGGEDWNSTYDSVDDVKAAAHYTIVSDGYKDMYLGHFAVMWNIYYVAANGTTSSTRYQLPSSALFYDIYTYNSTTEKYDIPKTGITVDSNGKITSTSAVPASFIETLKGGNHRGTWSNDSISMATYWSTFVSLYNACVENPAPAIITYETAITASDSGSGHPDDPGLRNDGRWYYSKANASWEVQDENLFAANIIIEYKNSASDASWTEDTYSTTVGGTAISENEVAGYASGLVGTATGAAPAFTNTGANQVFAYNSVTGDNFEFGVTADTSVGSTQSYKFVGWYVKTDDTTYVPVNETNIAKLTGEYAKLGAVTLVARYLPDTDNLTINHNLYANAVKYSDSSPAVGTGSGTPLVTAIDIVNGGTTTPLVSGNNTTTTSVSGSTLYTYTSDASNKLKITLTSEPDSYSTLDDIYRQINPPASGGTADASGYVSEFVSSSTGNGPYGITGWTNVTISTDTNGITTLTMEIPVANLFDETALKTNIINFYSNYSRPSFTIIYRYYDRDSQHSLPETIKTSSTDITYTNVTLLDDTTVNEVTTKGLTNTIAANLPNVISAIDDYKFWATQSTAASAGGFGGLSNYHAAKDADGKYQTYSATGVSLTAHADYYGYGQEEVGCKVSDGQNWVTYYSDAAMTTKVDEATALANPGSVNTIVVWGFNTPKEYDMTFNKPENSQTTLVETASNSGLFKADSESGAVTSGKFFYNEKCGGAAADGDTAINQISNYMQNVFNATNGTGSIHDYSSKNTTDVDGTTIVYNEAPKTVTNSTTSGETRTTYKYVFDGWYTNDGVKVSSDARYGDRVSTTLVLTAYYKLQSTTVGETTTTETIEISPELTMTKNRTECFVDTNKTEKVRYVTSVNAINCDDSDPRIQDIAIIYILLGTNNLDDSTVKTAIDTELKNTTNGLGAKVANALLADHSTSCTKDTSYSFDINGVTARVAIYAYDVVATQNDGNANTAVTEGQVRLTNKNRAQFSLILDADKVADGGTRSDVVVLAAVTLDDDYTGTGTITVDSSEVIPTENIIRYKNVDVDNLE